MLSDEVRPGTLTRVSDPVVAYDRVHGVWLASVLGIRDTADGLASSLLTSRSADGVNWGAPIVTAPDEGDFAHDKNWIACDNGTASRFAGRCYVAWTEVALIAESPRMATVTAETDIRAHGMTSWEFRRLAENNAALAWKLLESTLKRVQELEQARHAAP